MNEWPFIPIHIMWTYISLWDHYNEHLPNKVNQTKTIEDIVKSVDILTEHFSSEDNLPVLYVAKQLKKCPCFKIDKTDMEVRVNLLELQIAEMQRLRSIHISNNESEADDETGTAPSKTVSDPKVHVSTAAGPMIRATTADPISKMVMDNISSGNVHGKSYASLAENCTDLNFQWQEYRQKRRNVKTAEGTKKI